MGKAEDIIEALGGADNIVDARTLRRPILPPSVADPSLVDEPALKAAGAFGILSAGSVLQIIVGERLTACPWTSTASSAEEGWEWRPWSCPPCAWSGCKSSRMLRTPCSPRRCLAPAR